MENRIEISTTELSNRIYSLRGVQVMLDTDLAEIYQVETKALKRSVKRNIERFPADFMFELSKEEVKNLRSRIWISSLESFSDASFGNASKAHTNARCQFGTIRPDAKFMPYMPFVFTELGVAMLSSVLNSQRAIQLNIEIMRTFVQVRKQHKNSQFEALEKRIERMEAQLIPASDPVSIIKTIVAEHFGLRVEDLKSPTRTKAILRARHIAIYFMRKHTGRSLSEIGWHFGQRDHSTVLHAYQKIEAISGKIKNLEDRVFGALACKAL